MKLNFGLHIFTRYINEHAHKNQPDTFICYITLSLIVFALFHLAIFYRLIFKGWEGVQLPNESPSTSAIAVYI